MVGWFFGMRKIQKKQEEGVVFFDVTENFVEQYEIEYAGNEIIIYWF